MAAAGAVVYGKHTSMIVITCQFFLRNSDGVGVRLTNGYGMALRNYGETRLMFTPPPVDFGYWLPTARWYAMNTY